MLRVLEAGKKAKESARIGYIICIGEEELSRDMGRG